jgi:hypothetical protein
VNDCSIVLKVEFPAVRIAATFEPTGRTYNRSYLRMGSPWSLLLGSDAQTTSLALVTADFPPLGQPGAPPNENQTVERGRDPLSAQVFKVPRHVSRRGIHPELAERINADVALVSSVSRGSDYDPSHLLATEAIRQAMRRFAPMDAARPADHDLGIHYTGATARSGDDIRKLGSIALVLTPRRRSSIRMWRFGDGPREQLDLNRAERLSPVRSSR